MATTQNAAISTKGTSYFATMAIAMGTISKTAPYSQPRRRATKAAQNAGANNAITHAPTSNGTLGHVGSVSGPRTLKAATIKTGSSNARTAPMSNGLSFMARSIHAL